jgi:hypothetical protein
MSENIVTDLINALSGSSSVNTVQHAVIDEVVFSMSSAPSSGGKTGLLHPLLGNGSVNTFQRIGPCYESGDVINNRDGVFRQICAAKDFAASISAQYLSYTIAGHEMQQRFEYATPLASGNNIRHV